MSQESETQVETLFTLSKVFNEKIPIGRKTHNQQFLQRVVDTMHVEPDGKVGTRQTNGYYLSTLEDAYNRYQMEYADTRGVKGDSILGTDSDLLEIKKAQMLKDNIIKDRQIEKFDLALKQLKSKLVDYEEAYQYLTTRKAIEGAVLRRIFLVLLPIDIPRMVDPATGAIDLAKVRKQGEEYYNSVMKTCNETVKLWEEEYTTDATFEAAVERLVQSIEEKLKETNATTDKETPQATA